ncbi:UNVERIFIED_CONTAM: hypothetical protein FKN15_043197 [Acipenser sinensis]
MGLISKLNVYPSAMKAAVLIQRWYRRYMARIEIRRRYTWSIFQSIEYAGEQDQLQLSSFFTFMLDNFTHLGGASPDLISQFLDPTSDPMEEEGRAAKYEKIEVPDSYPGPRLSFPLTVAHTNALLRAFKQQQQQLHARYVLQLLHETKKFLKKMPNIIHLSTSYTKEITICAMKAAVLIQRWYRRYMARIEIRRRYTWSIFQSIEYAGEQDQLQLSSFFTFMLDNFTHLGGASPGLISIEEFRQTWRLFSSHLHVHVDNAAIDDLARSIDFNKDGSIDFNEFLEAFRVVHKLDSKEKH